MDFETMEKAIRDHLNDKMLPPEIFEDAGLNTIQEISLILNEQSIPIEAVERIEALLKFVLRKVLSKQLKGVDGRQLCSLLKQQGLMFKFKPYAVKASNPFGYSIFLQRPNEGFSFQNHLEHKTEVFHILRVLPGGYVFLCQYEEWKQHYEPQTFVKWLNGESHPFFDGCRFFPKPGDTFVISELGIVHTVIGCVLEEFATISTDMVQRLHDQNDRNLVPMPPVSDLIEALADLNLPTEARHVDMLQGNEISVEGIEPIPHTYGRSVLLTDTFLKASHFWVDPNCIVPAEIDNDRVTVIRVFRGRCHVYLQDQEEHSANLAVDPIIAEEGDVIVIPNGIHFIIENPAEMELACSEHRILSDVALR